MLKPAKKVFDLYWAKDTIVVTDLVSEAPIQMSDPHKITMEKMLVDIYCDKLIRVHSAWQNIHPLWNRHLTSTE